MQKVLIIALVMCCIAFGALDFVTHHKLGLVDSELSRIRAELETQRKADESRQATIEAIRNEHLAALSAFNAEKAAALTALSVENKKHLEQFAETANYLEAQLAEARSARKEAEQKYSDTVARVKEAADLIRLRELQVVYPELRLFDSKRLDLNEKYLASIELQARADGITSSLVQRECSVVYDNKTDQEITPNVVVTFFDQHGTDIGSVDLGWVFDKVGPGERRTWAKTVFLRDANPVYWRIKVE